MYILLEGWEDGKAVQVRSSRWPMHACFVPRRQTDDTNPIDMVVQVRLDAPDRAQVQAADIISLHDLPSGAQAITVQQRVRKCHTTCWTSLRDH